MFKKQSIFPSPLMGEGGVRVIFLFRSFEFVSCFGFRASNFVLQIYHFSYINPFPFSILMGSVIW
jgi:hypothetical protein